MQTYDPGLVTVTWGPHIFHGYVEGSMVNVARDADAFAKYVGTDGEVARVRNRNRAGSVQIHLAQTSSSNDYLSARAAEDELLGTAVAPFVMKDLGGRTLVAAADAWIRKLPDIEESGNIGGRTWVLDTGPMHAFVGGN